jgi:phosphoribosylanthranilate isomerase
LQRIIVQIYEVQTPLEAEALIELDVDHIGSVVVSEEHWKLPQLKDTIKTIHSTAAKSSLIPLYNHPESVLRTLDYYQPDIVHFCEALSDRDDIWDFCDQLIHLQAFVRKHFPEIKIMRSIPIAQTRENKKIPTIELAQHFETASDFFLTDTILMNSCGTDPAGAGFCRNHRGNLQLGNGAEACGKREYSCDSGRRHFSAKCHRGYPAGKAGRSG